jgi:hypothetical protein
MRSGKLAVAAVRSSVRTAAHSTAQLRHGRVVDRAKLSTR